LKLSRLTQSGTLRGRFLHGALWNTISAIVSRSSGLITTIIIVHILGRQSFGEFVVLQSTIALFATFATVGFGTTANRWVAALHKSDPSRVGRIIALLYVVGWTLGLATSITLLVFAKRLAAGPLHAPQLSAEIQLSAIALLFSSLNSVQAGILVGFESFEALAYLNAISGIMALTLTALGGWYGELRGTVIGSGLGFVASWLLFAVRLRQEYRTRGITIKREHMRKDALNVFNFSVPAFLGSAMVGPTLWFCSTLLLRVPGGYAEMAVIRITTQWQIAILFLQGSAIQVLLPILSSISTDGPRYRKVLGKSVFLSIGVTAPASLLFIAFSKVIARMYGASFLTHTVYLCFLISALTPVLMAVTDPIGQAIAAKGLMWHGFALNAIRAVTQIGLTLLWSRYGALGFLCALAASYFVHIITVLTYSRLVLGLGMLKDDNLGEAQA
jgi:O-antigen/teichoic acid export membrane protein